MALEVGDILAGLSVPHFDFIFHQATGKEDSGVYRVEADSSDDPFVTFELHFFGLILPSVLIFVYFFEIRSNQNFYHLIIRACSDKSGRFGPVYTVNRTDMVFWLLVDDLNPIALLRQVAFST